MIFAAIVLLAHLVEAATGFGGAVIALALGGQFYPLEELVPVLVPLNLALSVFLVARYGKAIDYDRLRGQIVPLTGLGLLLGLLAERWASAPSLRLFFGAAVCAVALRGLAGGQRSEEPRGWRGPALLIGGGVLHGIYAAGGPLIVAYASSALKDKTALRSTLSALWLAGNLALLAALCAKGTMTAAVWRQSAFLFPPMAVGTALGVALHERIPQREFLKLTQSLIALAGAALCLR